MAKSVKRVKKKNDTKPASHASDLVRLNRIGGQIEGVERMIADGRYCLDIVNQIQSISAALKSVEILIMERHLRHCVTDAIHSRNKKQTETKIAELVTLFKRR